MLQNQLVMKDLLTFQNIFSVHPALHLHEIPLQSASLE